jgi:predicted Zn-ribbon and HTH transcriptional regulator
MRIAELEAHHGEYTALEATIRKMLYNREFPAVFSVCEASFPHIVPAIKYRKKRGIEPETPTFLSLGVICKYAPPLFEHAVLQSLYEFVKSTTLLAKHQSGYFQAVQRAVEDEEIARALWNHLNAWPGSLQEDAGKELGVSEESAVRILDVWVEFSVISRRQEKNSCQLYLRSRLDAVVEGVCHTCGVRGKGHKELFFKPIRCKKCGTEDYYHIVYASDP